jgi:hypothetical protein
VLEVLAMEVRAEGFLEQDGALYGVLDGMQVDWTGRRMRHVK